MSSRKTGRRPKGYTKNNIKSDEDRLKAFNFIESKSNSESLSRRLRSRNESKSDSSPETSQKSRAQLPIIACNILNCIDNPPVASTSNKKYRKPSLNHSKSAKRQLKPEITQNVEKECLSINSLPEELLLSVFAYLGHGDWLSTRRVCKRWDETLTHWKGFTNNVVYLFKQKSFASWVLSQSEVPWKKIRFEKFRLNEKGFGNIDVPPSVLHSIKSVDFCKSIVSWEGIQHNVLKFPELEELKITQCKRRRTGLTRWTKVNKKSTIVPRQMTTRGVQQTQQNLADAFKKVTSISLELRRISDITFYLNQFNELNMSGLISLSLQDIYDGVESTTPENASKLLSAVWTLIHRSQSTLKILRIKFVTLEVVNRFFLNVIDRLLTQQHKYILDLNVLDIWSFASEPINHTDIEIFKKFIASQKNLQELRLPKVGFILVPECLAVTRAIPKDIKKLHVSSDKYMITDFLGNFSKLRDFACDFEIRPYVLSDKKYPLLKWLEVQGTFTTVSISEIVKSFPNITRLNLNGNTNESRPSMDDTHLQLLIKNLTNIKILIIGVCHRISDFGVTGIKHEYCDKLYRSRALCLDHTMEAPSEQVYGRPISDLKGLTDLTITGSTEISDVGIFYGFRFKELRSLSLRGNDDISDWGLDWLAKLNPDLHRMNLECGKWVSRVGISRLKFRLRRMEKRNLICLWPNTEYYSSDESYALESTDGED